MIELKYFERSDFKKLISWINSPSFLQQWSGSAFEYPLTESQLEKYIENANNNLAETLVYKVIEQDSGDVIGHISLGRIDRKNKSARIGKVLVGEPYVRGKGIGKKMIREVLKIAFNDLQLHRVNLGVFDFNEPAITCYEKIGFKKEGLLRDSSKHGDEYWSQWEMSILENEWLKIKNDESLLK
ncbi:N-acetyltransferase [Lysinibacillus yapensis]|uniref:N-acetyltransferase n=1 Tax=Ureibacillus yapensis TaxID=2304605 RepID=A0A396S920_9BACL|nr:GNAT family protein [Lysinibacillus yapensis]RHW30920.1 N-acetyltransferase [Lysinibacillus yapensis]